MTRRTLCKVFIAVALVGATAAASVLASAPDGGPSRGRTLAAALTLPLRAGRLEAAQRLGVDATLRPAPAVALPPDFWRPRITPWRVGIQAGHWKADQLPGEQGHLRDSTGAVSGLVREVDINLQIARLVADLLQRRGIVVDLLPATVPAGYEADAFVAIHADGGAPGERGWKIAAPWRTSAASRTLAREVAAAYGVLSGIPEDRYGVTYLMRGYYAYSWNRYQHATAPWTPAMIIETGYVTSPLDRQVLVDDPEKVAEAVSVGIVMYLGQSASLPRSSFVPLVYPSMVVSSSRAVLRRLPEEQAPVAASLEPGTIVRPLDEENGWYEVQVRGTFRVFGWIPRSELEPGA